MCTIFDIFKELQIVSPQCLYIYKAGGSTDAVWIPNFYRTVILKAFPPNKVGNILFRSKNFKMYIFCRNIYFCMVWLVVIAE